MCDLHLPINKELTNSDVFEPLKITAYHFWSVAQSAGTEPEQDVPKHREGRPLKTVPRFKHFIKENGAWVVDKFRQYVDDRWGGVHDPLIVCPEEMPAAILAEHMKMMLRWSILQIPR